MTFPIFSSLGRTTEVPRQNARKTPHTVPQVRNQTPGNQNRHEILIMFSKKKKFFTSANHFICDKNR